MKKELIISTIMALGLGISINVYSASDNISLKAEDCNLINESYIKSDCTNYNKDLSTISGLQTKILSSLDEKRKNQFNTEISLWENDVNKFCSKNEYNTELYYNRYGCLNYFSPARVKVLSSYSKNGYKVSDNLTGTYSWKEGKDIENTFTMTNLENNKIKFQFAIAQPVGTSYHFGSGDGVITTLKNKAVYSFFRDGKRCEIRITFWGNHLDMRQKTGEGYDCGFGTNVVAYNTFIKLNNEFKELNIH